MWAKLICIGTGVSIPKLDIGLNLVSGCYLILKNTINSPGFVLGVAETTEIGGQNGTLFFSTVVTEWASLDLKKHPWMCSQEKLINQECEITLSGTLAIKGKIDISLKIFDDNHEETFSFNKFSVASTGLQLSDTRIRGKLRSLMGTISLEQQQMCGQSN